MFVTPFVTLEVALPRLLSAVVAVAVAVVTTLAARVTRFAAVAGDG